MQFKVPQFIDIEDKVFGPFTFVQFVYMAGGAGFAYLTFRFLPIFIAIILGPAIIAFALALTFMKYNEKPFIHVVESFVKYYTHSRLYLWHKQPTSKSTPLSRAANGQGTIADKAAALQNRATLTESNLKTLSWSLDVIDPKK